MKSWMASIARQPVYHQRQHDPLKHGNLREQLHRPRKNVPIHAEEPEPRSHDEFDYPQSRECSKRESVGVGRVFDASAELICGDVVKFANSELRIAAETDNSVSIVWRPVDHQNPVHCHIRYTSNYGGVSKGTELSSEAKLECAKFGCDWKCVLIGTTWGADRATAALTSMPSTVIRMQKKQFSGYFGTD
ncbi:hypothetical protein L596_005761 [Steinernema carpocapsae]|uniref:Uncharacterized protein n=1 Tax=Steinernema carpocapsae TaxID=34508 RepID=A0A4U8V017_STECR|nr:hypothetical protein L596_005761 [Steinernema carpocapsae]